MGLRHPLPACLHVCVFFEAATITAIVTFHACVCVCVLLILILLFDSDLMCDVVLHEATNKMGAKNMAIVFSPNLYEISQNKMDNPMAAMTMSQKVYSRPVGDADWLVGGAVSGYADDNMTKESAEERR